jgi:hypothetical protein
MSSEAGDRHQTDQDRDERPSSRERKLGSAALSDYDTPTLAESTVGEIARNNSAGWYCIDVGGSWVCCIEPVGNNGDWAALARGRTREDALRELIRQAHADGRV